VKLLALDTSSLACSVALLVEDATFERHEEQPREHTRTLLPMIRSLMAEAETDLGDLDAIVLGNGPGSFIGMRIGASVAQGLAFGASLQIVPVSSMAAVAVDVLTADSVDEVVVAQDARMNQVYLGTYQRNADGLPVALTPERLHPLTTIEELNAGDPDRRVGAGYGWERYPELWASNKDRVGKRLETYYPHARNLLPLGVAGLEAGDSLDPQDIEPAYLRTKVAEKPEDRS
jgi:tRNA threonylcarbamoyladenosine biosynthesis protein TsaB